jgi:hypothetical protein
MYEKARKTPWRRVPTAGSAERGVEQLLHGQGDPIRRCSYTCSELSGSPVVTCSGPIHGGTWFSLFVPPRHVEFDGPC